MGLEAGTGEREERRAHKGGERAGLRPSAGTTRVRLGDAAIGRHVQEVEVAPQIVQGTLGLELSAGDGRAVDDAPDHLFEVVEHRRIAVVAVADIEYDHEGDLWETGGGAVG